MTSESSVPSHRSASEGADAPPPPPPPPLPASGVQMPATPPSVWVTAPQPPVVATTPPLPMSPPAAPLHYESPQSNLQPPGVPRYGAILPPSTVRPSTDGGSGSGSSASGPSRAPVPDRRGLWAAVGAVVATALIAAGFGLAKIVENDSSPVADSASRTTVAAATTQASTTSTGSAPVAANASEPAAEVAVKVGPSVVLINNVQASSSGSGIVYDKTGVIFTNAHVVEGATTVDITFSNGRTERNVAVIARDVARDIALLRVAARDDLVPAVFAKTADVRVGQIAIAIGAPFGLDQSVTQGIVSAVGRIVPSFGNCGNDMIQTDAPINPGNSGGALVDKQGRLIGMNTSIRTSGATSTGSVGVGFAVPGDTIKADVDRMLKGEATDVAFLGVGQAAVESNGDGVLVGSVSANSPASTAGIRQGDVITTLNGDKVSTFADIRARIQTAKPGDVFEMKITRDGQSQTVKATLTKSPNCRS
ncbi:MAG: PDZ domain-containing protein [Actinobacteria bacterium]|nr:MAG: PDZ domain-containing protein [Actinomycetota bacterium]